MKADRWDRVDDLFRRALERPPDERSAFVARECAADEELRAAVEDLLDAAGEASGFLEEGAEDLWELPLDELFPDVGTGGPDGPSRSNDTGFDRSGDRLGPYRLVRRLAQGGMASVYLAERDDGQWDQQVAVKILKRGLDTEDVVRRFLAERQILSSMDHPHVARLLDGGATPDGLPYLVMEYVEGTPIDEYCDTRRLSVDDRLALFCDVGRAVQEAHRHLVVHRDLKPSNVMVDTRGRVKLLDFGIAKLLDPAPGDVTRTGLRPLTPAYASPEQVTGEPITTASDVYQLGLLLCELLSGSRPYEVRALSPARAERIITETSPSPPSTLIDDGAPAARSTTHRDLARTLRGDLDTITLRALSKEPENRYDSAGALVDDIQRYRRGEPVTARRDTLGYRVHRFVDRHRGGVTAALVVAVLLLTSTTAALVQARRAERERNLARAEAAKAEEVKDVLVGLFRSADPYAPADPERGSDITVVEALEHGADQARRELADRPAILGEVLASIGEVLLNLGQYERAAPVTRDALDALRRAHGPASGEVAEALLDFANQSSAVEGRDSARALFDTALATARSAYGPDDPRLAPFHTAIGNFLSSSSGGAADSARLHLEQAISLYRSADSIPEAELSQVLYKLSDYHRLNGDFDAARSLLDEAAPLARAAYGGTHPELGFVLVSEATLSSVEGRYDASRAAFEEALAILGPALGEDHPFVLATRNNLAVMLDASGDLEAAEAAYRRVLGDRRRVLGENDSETASALQNLAANLNKQGRYDEAERLLDRAATALRVALGPDHPTAAFPYLTRTEIRLNQGDHAGAEASARQALGILGRSLGERHWIHAVASCRLGRALAGQGRVAEARPRIIDALGILEAAAPGSQAERVEECRAAREALGTASG